MASDRGEQEELIASALRRLGRATGRAFTSRLLTGGGSGSSVYAVEIDGQPAILKVAPPGGNPQAAARACREILFYRDLANRVPISTPRVLNLDFSDREGTVILLNAYSPSITADNWTEGDYLEIARQLGRLHAMFWNETAALPGWLRTKPRVTLAQCQSAASMWRAQSAREELHALLEPRLPRIERLVMAVPELESRLSTLPFTLCHGDFHPANLLRGSAGGWIWADWQDTRLGPGVDDLAFFWQRAFVAAEPPPPYQAMVQAYRTSLESEGGIVIPLEQLERNLWWSELRIWLVDWPSFFGFLSASQIDRILRRSDMLVERLKSLPHANL